ncbi:MAG TPA: prepilin-type N-terminal cleavage/methylation domain-containing protein [Steroidobacter sp.]
MRSARGFTLVELMISMMLGLVVIGGALGVILSNRQSYRTNEGLSQVQESARTAFELLARDVRQAGVTGCDSNGRVANVVQTDPSLPVSWWGSWFGIQGYAGTQTDPAVGFGTSGSSNRINGTDSLQLQGLEGTGISIARHRPVDAQFDLYASTTAIATGDILMVCDFDHAAIFKVSQYTSSGTVVQHVAGGGYPRNCTTGLGYPTDCTTPNPYTFPANSQLARVASVDWYVGDNQRAAQGEPGRSLFRRRMAAAPEEIVAGVTNLRITYREAGRTDFRAADVVGTWANVNAVMIELTLQSADQRVSSDATVNTGRIERVFTNIVTLRNRVP